MNPSGVGFDEVGRATADHVTRGIRRPRSNGRHDGGIGNAQAANAMDAELAIHHRIWSATDLRRAHRVTETRRARAREIREVMLARLGAGDHLDIADAVER